MATLSQMCVLPDGWGTPSISEKIGMDKKMQWKTAKRMEHARFLEYRERERIRTTRRVSGTNLEHDRRRVHRETMGYDMPVLESGRKMFAVGKGQLQPKKAKNTASSERAGTIGRTIVVKRFDGSRLTCVCKSKIY